MKILLLDDHPLFRAGLRLLLGTIGRNLTILEAGTIAEATAQTVAHPDLQLCLLDLNLRNENGLTALARIKVAAPEVAVVIVSSSDDAAIVRTCLDAGAMCFISKSTAPEVLTGALEHVLEGAVYLPPRLLNREDVPLNCLSHYHPGNAMCCVAYAADYRRNRLRATCLCRIIQSRNILRRYSGYLMCITGLKPSSRPVR